MHDLNRRQFLLRSAAFSGTAALAGFTTLRGAEAAQRAMSICLSCGSIGVSANQLEAIRLAERHGFESVEASAEYLARLSDAEVEKLVADMKQKGIRWGAAGLPVEFRQDDARFKSGFQQLPRLAAAAKRAGVERWGTWLMPSDGMRTYLANFKLHSARLREVAAVLKDHGQRLGLEYVGTKTLRDRARFPFVHCLPELKELIAEIGTGNVGVILDSWHWWQADDTVADILSLKNSDVVSVDLNDAPSGIPKDRQIDGRRELPMATGVIDVGAFLNALSQIGYDGPVRAEPFNKPLNDLNNDDACAATAAAMKKAFALVK